MKCSKRLEILVLGATQKRILSSSSKTSTQVEMKVKMHSLAWYSVLQSTSGPPATKEENKHRATNIDDGFLISPFHYKPTLQDALNPSNTTPTTEASSISGELQIDHGDKSIESMGRMW